MKLYQYPQCSTCKKAIKWLKAHDIEFESVHIVDTPPSRDEIKRLWQKSGLDLKKFFNTSGQSYRALNLKDRYVTLSDDERLDLLAADGKLIKRPLTENAEHVLVGFKEANYQQAFA